jgi:two-component system, NarL family, nitrate/nitrite response regulator NarL
MMRRRPVATILIAPSPLLREGLARILSAADFRVIASASSVEDIALSSSAHQQPVLLILDAEAGIAQIARFREQYPSSRITILADQEDLENILAAFRAGANAYFGKSATCDAFIKVLELVVLGETILPPALLPVLLDGGEDPENGSAQQAQMPDTVVSDSNVTPRLSSREKGILRCLAEGDSNKVIARKVEIAEATVKVHVKAILRKIRVHNRTQAAIWAMNNWSTIWGTNIAASVAAAPPALPALEPSCEGGLARAQSNGAASTEVVEQVVGVKSLEARNLDRAVRTGSNRRLV